MIVALPTTTQPWVLAHNKHPKSPNIKYIESHANGSLKTGLKTTITSKSPVKREVGLIRKQVSLSICKELGIHLATFLDNSHSILDTDEYVSISSPGPPPREPWVTKPTSDPRFLPRPVCNVQLFPASSLRPQPGCHL